MPLTKANTSGFKGVSFSKHRGVWCAAIKVNYRSRFLGHFHSPVNAAHAYDDAARLFFGDFACLNFPNPPVS
jgi:hypothetical protein